jgi:uncharacterized protein (TIGR02266 family)
MLPDRSFSELFGDDVADPITHTRARTAPAERRTSARVPFEVDVVVGTPTQFFSGISTDLSPDGLFIASRRSVEVGTSVALEFALPEGQVLARGVVRWLRAPADGVVPGMAISFEDLGAADRELITKFCGDTPRTYTYDEIKAATNN